jgi:hypothetical protein
VGAAEDIDDNAENRDLMLWTPQSTFLSCRCCWTNIALRKVGPFAIVAVVVAAWLLC